MDNVNTNRSKIVKVVAVLVLVCISIAVDAQCPMCRMSAETNLQNGGTEGRGLNTGILYMLSMPYLLISVIGFLWYRHRKQEIKESLEIKQEDI